MAETWVAGSSCRMVHVPWDAQYTKVVQFDSPEARDEYLNGLQCSVNLEIKNQTYIRPNTPIVVDAPYSAVYGANYLIVDNPAQPVEGAKPEQLFYFITDTQYASPASTRLILQLDVWQTRFMAGAELSTGFLERGHYPVKHAYDDLQEGASLCSTLKKWCTAPEALEIGSDYLTYVHSVASLQGQCYIAIVSTADLANSFGSVSAPVLRTASGTTEADNVPSGASVYLLDASRFDDFTAYMAAYPWVSQNIVGMYYVPRVLMDGAPGTQQTVGDSGIPIYRTFAGMTDHVFSSVNLKNATLTNIDAAWRDTYNAYLKLQAYPYTVIEMTAFNGSPLMLKPECFGVDNTEIRAYTFLQQADYRAAFMPRGYGFQGDYGMAYNYQDVDGTGHQAFSWFGDWMDSCLWVGDFPQFSTVNNQATLALASTAHTRQYSYDAVGWQTARSTAQNRAALEQSNMSLATQAANQQITNDLINKQQQIGIMSGGVGVVGSLLSANFGGAAAGAAQTGLNYLSSQASQNAQNAQFANNQQLQGSVADLNYQLGQYMAQSNAQQSIAAINASVQDTQLTPPSIVGQQGGSLFNLKNGLIGVFVRVKRLQQLAKVRVSQYFQRYGYAYGGWIVLPDRLNIMSEFSYWKVLDLALECATANETESEAIRGIFARGVTVYSDPEKLSDGDVSANMPY